MDSDRSSARSGGGHKACRVAHGPERQRLIGLAMAWLELAVGETCPLRAWKMLPGRSPAGTRGRHRRSSPARRAPRRRPGPAPPDGGSRRAAARARSRACGSPCAASHLISTAKLARSFGTRGPLARPFRATGAAAQIRRTSTSDNVQALGTVLLEKHCSPNLEIGGRL